MRPPQSGGMRPPPLPGAQVNPAMVRPLGAQFPNRPPGAPLPPGAVPPLNANRMPMGPPPAGLNGPPPPGFRPGQVPPGANIRPMGSPVMQQQFPGRPPHGHIPPGVRPMPPNAVPPPQSPVRATIEGVTNQLETTSLNAGSPYTEAGPPAAYGVDPKDTPPKVGGRAKRVYNFNPDGSPAANAPAAPIPQPNPMQPQPSYNAYSQPGVPAPQQQQPDLSRPPQPLAGQSNPGFQQSPLPHPGPGYPQPGPPIQQQGANRPPVPAPGLVPQYPFVPANQGQPPQPQLQPQQQQQFQPPPMVQQQQQQQNRARIDPNQIPSPVQVQEQDQQTFEDKEFGTCSKGMVPLASTDFKAVDEGGLAWKGHGLSVEGTWLERALFPLSCVRNCNPRFMRITTYNIPFNDELLDTSQLPLGLIVQPLAKLRRDEEQVHLVDFGEQGPVRCRRCKAYINSAVLFIDGGRKFMCNLCGFDSEDYTHTRHKIHLPIPNSPPRVLLQPGHERAADGPAHATRATVRHSGVHGPAGVLEPGTGARQLHLRRRRVVERHPERYARAVLPGSRRYPIRRARKGGAGAAPRG
ncbi:hypothetical protein BC936DRAFT_142834 [Jimgerdemannia flammicorona]|uniref:Zinc finger Sec23/Sec24-type domain-containing protein n=1 Tax=Jimgerdemannia flammicorona TaxID=994334 RepID=A0A432ZZS3_9FUNG|nr:hypothetical protein BC936DRAFT_142834 [Jimgerdemannia flammicorona]